MDRNVVTSTVWSGKRLKLRSNRQPLIMESTYIIVVGGI